MLKTTLEDLQPGDGTEAKWKRVGDLLDDARAAHELLRLCKMFIPTPEGISGYDDQNAPELVKQTVEEASRFWQALEKSK